MQWGEIKVGKFHAKIHALILFVGHKNWSLKEVNSEFLCHFKELIKFYFITNWS